MILARGLSLLEAVNAPICSCFVYSVYKHSRVTFAYHYGNATENSEFHPCKV